MHSVDSSGLTGLPIACTLCAGDGAARDGALGGSIGEEPSDRANAGPQRPHDGFRSPQFQRLRTMSGAASAKLELVDGRGHVTAVYGACFRPCRDAAGLRWSRAAVS